MSYDREYARRWRAKNKDRQDALAKVWAAKNPNKVAAKRRRYALRHPEVIKAATARNVGSGAAALAQARWRTAHPEMVRLQQSSRQVRKSDAELERDRARSRARYQEKRELHKAQVYAYRKLRRQQYIEYAIKRRALKAGAAGSHSFADWEAKILEFGGCCAYCGLERPLSRDHLLPLSRGGSNSIENIVPACRSCNSSKRTATVEEFLLRFIGEAA